MNKLFKNVAVSAALGLAAVALPAQAALMNVGGVWLDPDYTDGGEADFITQFDFTQWYTSYDTNKAAGLGYNDAAEIGYVLSSLDPSSSDSSGYYLQGVGEFYRVNGLSYSNLEQFVVGGGELTFAFGGIGLNKDQTFDISNAWAVVYIDQGPGTNYTHPTSNQGEVEFARDGNEWLRLEFTSLAFTNGYVGDGNVSAEFAIVGGLAADYFDPKSLSYNASAFFSRNPGAPVDPTMKYSNGGNGSAIGNTEAIPEPSLLGLLGIGLIGLGAASRRRKA